MGQQQATELGPGKCMIKKFCLTLKEIMIFILLKCKKYVVSVKHAKIGGGVNLKNEFKRKIKKIKTVTILLLPKCFLVQ